MYNSRAGIRSCVIAGVFLCLLFLLAGAVQAKGVEKPERTLIGYSSELTVRPGDTVEFMVNALNGGSYKADLVRVINGESVTKSADQFKVEYTPSSFEGTYEGTPQELDLGFLHPNRRHHGAKHIERYILTRRKNT